MAGLSEELAEVLPDLVKKTGCDDWTVMQRPLDRRECRIHFLHSANFRRRGVVLKIYQTGSVGENLARNLHRKSRALLQGATAAFTVPEPVCFMQDRNALAIEFIDAPLAGVLLKKRFRSRERRDSIIRMSAGWLRWFHDQLGVTHEPFKAASYSVKLSKMLEKIESLRPGAIGRDRLLSDCIEVSMRVAEELEGVEFPHAMAHGDFTPFNLFIREGTTVGFDYGANRRLPVFHDICRFMVYLDVRRMLPCPESEVRAYGCRRDDLEVFMNAYSPDGTAMFEGLWPRLQLMELTRRITALTLRREGRRRHFHFFSVYEMAWLRRNARLLHKELAGRVSG